MHTTYAMLVVLRQWLILSISPQITDLATEAVLNNMGSWITYIHWELHM